MSPGPKPTRESQGHKTRETNNHRSGATLQIEAKGTVKETILEGAYVQLEVKYGYIRLISTQADLCNEIKNVDLECPIEKGKLSIVKSVDLPKEIPPVSRLPPFPLTLVLADTVMLIWLDTGQVHRPGGRLQQGRRAHHMPDGHRLLWPQADGRCV